MKNDKPSPDCDVISSARAASERTEIEPSQEMSLSGAHMLAHQLHASELGILKATHPASADM